MARTKTIFAKNGVSVADYGVPEYLDGATMQFTVCLGERYPFGRTLAYFDDEEDALLFAKAKARRRARKKEHKCANGATDTAYSDPPVSVAPSGEASGDLKNRVGSTSDTSD